MKSVSLNPEVLIDKLNTDCKGFQIAYNNTVTGVDTTAGALKLVALGLQNIAGAVAALAVVQAGELERKLSGAESSK